MAKAKTGRSPGGFKPKDAFDTTRRNMQREQAALCLNLRWCLPRPDGEQELVERRLIRGQAQILAPNDILDLAIDTLIANVP